MTEAGTRGLAVRALLVCSAMVLCALPSAAQGGVVARAASVTGMSLLAGPTGASTVLTPGAILNPGDRIDTRGGGQVVIDLSDGSMVVVAPGSLVLLKDFHEASSLRELFEITLGMVRVKINHFAGRPNPYRMNSPTASIAVRGTEFSIQVDAQGVTAVIVYEGLVEVSDRRDPSRSTLVEGGRGVLLQGQVFQLFAAPQNRGGDGGDRNNNYDVDKDHRNPPPPPPVAAPAPAPAQPAQPPPPPQAGAGHPDAAAHNDNDANSAPGSSAYDRYISGLADVAQLPFLMRYNAFADAHLDSLENPAYATQFRQGEARIFLMPSYSGTADLSDRATPITPGGTVPGDYSISPQFSLFTPIGGGFFAGGSVSASRVGNSTVTGLNGATGASYAGGYASPGAYAISVPGGGSTSDYYSGSLVLAKRIGRNSFGAEWEELRGVGTAQMLAGDADGDGGQPQITQSIQSNSSVSETRFTAGYSLDASRTAKLGVFYRYGFIHGTDAGVASVEGYGGPSAGPPNVGLWNASPQVNSTLTGGHSSEIGLRWRAELSQRWFYGVTASWLGLSLADALVRPDTVNSHQRDGAGRASLGFGLGYQLSRRVLLSWDAAGASTRSAATRFEDATAATLQNGTADSHFVSTQAAVMVDLTRHLFTSASLMNVWHGSRLHVDLFPDQFGNRMLVEDSFFPLNSAVYPMAPRFSDFGAGWRFTRNFLVEYLFSTDYGFSGSSHTLLFRYTFSLKKE